MDTGRRASTALGNGSEPFTITARPADYLPQYCKERDINPVTVYAIDHVQMAMPSGQEDLARAFYGGILGLAEIPKPLPLAKRGGLWFERGVVTIHLGVEQDFRPAKKAHLALLVDDLAGLVKRCQEEGYQIDTLQPPLDDYNRVHIYDPFGNRIELMEIKVPPNIAEIKT